MTIVRFAPLPRRTWRTIFRIFILSTFVAIVATATYAAGCVHPINAKSFVARGGLLRPLRRFSERDGFVALECGKPGTPCNGGIVVRGVVTKNGIPMHLKIAGSDFSFHPDENEAAAFHIVSTMRYRPPQLNGRPVCVLMDWSFSTQAQPEP